MLLGYVFAGRRETTTRKKGQGPNCLVELWFLLGEWPGVLVCLFYAAVCEISSPLLLSESAKFVSPVPFSCTVSVVTWGMK